MCFAYVQMNALIDADTSSFVPLIAAYRSMGSMCSCMVCHSSGSISFASGQVLLKWSGGFICSCIALPGCGGIRSLCGHSDGHRCVHPWTFYSRRLQKGFTHLVRVAVGCGDASLGGIVCIVDTEVGALTFCAHSVLYSSDRKGWSCVAVNLVLTRVLLHVHVSGEGLAFGYSDFVLMSTSGHSGDYLLSISEDDAHTLCVWR